MKKGLLAGAAVTAALVPMIGATDIHFHKKPTNGRVRVACVGDSITNGALIPGCFFRSYPAQLGKMLGEGYHVENFGLNGRTLQPAGDMPYCTELEYRLSLEFKPDIVVIMLGTNDTRPWNLRPVEEFAEEYVKLVRVYQSLATAPRIVLCLTPWAINAHNMIMSLSNDTDGGALPQINAGIRLAAERLGLEVVDMYSLFENRLDLLCYDGVHPNYRGAKLIAETVKACL